MFLALGPSVDGAAAISVSSRATAHLGPSADASAVLRHAADGRAKIGES